MKKGLGQIEIKKGLSIQKYGGYNKANIAYYFIVEFDTEIGRKRVLESVPMHLAEKIERAEIDLKYYAEEYLKMQNPYIISKLKKNALLELDGFRMHLSEKNGKSYVMKCAKQLILPEEVYRYVKNLEKEDDEKIDESTNLKVYDCLMDILNNSRYKVKISQVRKKLEQQRDSFMELSKKDQTIVLKELLRLFKCDSSSIDLSLIGEGSQVGKITLNRDITKLNNLILIHQSITGLFEKKLNISEL